MFSKLLIFNRRISTVALYVCFTYIGTAHAVLAKRANVADARSPVASDFSFESRFANRGQGVVNLFTGSAVPRRKLLSISSRSGITYNLTLHYNGAVQGKAREYNQIDPTGYVGFGWNFAPEAIIVDAKGTETTDDDKYYYLQQDGVISEIIKLSDGSYKVKNAPDWKITREGESWHIRHTDGTLYAFGLSTNSRRYFEYGDGGFLDCEKKHTFTFQWDLAWISLANAAGGISFEYEQNTVPRCEDDLICPYDKIYMCNRANADYVGWYTPGGGCGGGCDHEFEDMYDCIKNRDVGCLQANADYYWLHTALPPDLKGQPLDKYYIERKAIGWKLFKGDVWEYWLAPRCEILSVPFKGGIYVDNSILRKIKTDNNQEIILEFHSKDETEYDAPIFGVNDVYLKEVLLFEDGEVKDKLALSYSADENETGEQIQVSHLKKGSQRAKRLLTGITSTLGSGVNNCVFDYSSDRASVGLLAGVYEPMTGKSTRFEYGTHEAKLGESEIYIVPVVERLVESGGTGDVPDIVTTYSYPTDPALQDYNASSGVAYWGEVTANSSNSGSIVTSFELDKENHLFGVRNKVEKYSQSSKLVSKEEYAYAAREFGETNSEWYLPVLIETQNTTDGVSAKSGTSECAIDPNSGMAKQSWRKNSDGKTLVTQRTYVYQEPGHAQMTSEHMYSQVACTKLIELSSFDPATCNVSSGNVVKATYTVWDDASKRPTATYAWNYGNSAGLAVSSFPDFDPANPTANGWQLTGTVDKYSSYGNVLQASDAKGTPNSTIYGTSFWVPVAAISGGAFSECAVFTCAYDLNESEGSTNYFDKFNGWEKGAKHGTSALEVNGTKKHFGEKSLYVKHALGPVRDVEVRSNSDYIFSAWIYPVTSNPIQFGIEAHTGSGTVDLSVNRSGLTLNKWQFIEIGVPLSGQSDVNDVKIWLGNTASMSASEFYVDDIRFYPKTSLVTTTYYDEKWRAPIVAVDANNNPGAFSEFDEYGRLSKTYKLDKTKCNDEAGAKVQRMGKEYHLMGEALRLVSPNGGEELILGQEYCIAWSGPSTVGTNGVDLYFHDGTEWTKLTSTPITEQNTYHWNVPPRSLANCRIKVQSVDDAAVKDESDGTFDIEMRSISSRFLPFKNHGFVRKRLMGLFAE